MTKKVKGNSHKSKKQVVLKPIQSSNEKIIWTFDNVDKDGCFAFNVHRPDFQASTVFEKMIDYSSMTWAEIERQTHDAGKSKHHRLLYDELSKEAQERIFTKQLYEEYNDSFYSFALTNVLRVIGIRDGRFFRVVWYDPKHEFCRSTLRHT